MRVIVCGGRHYADPLRMRQVMSVIRRDATVLVGGARGADSLAKQMCQALGIAVEEHPAQWDTFHKSAGPIRNQEMLDSGVDLVIAFPGGRGTDHMKSIARKAGVPVLEVSE